MENEEVQTQETQQTQHRDLGCRVQKSSLRSVSLFSFSLPLCAACCNVFLPSQFEWISGMEHDGWITQLFGVERMDKGDSSFQDWCFSILICPPLPPDLPCSAIVRDYAYRWQTIYARIDEGRSQISEICIKSSPLQDGFSEARCIMYDLLVKLHAEMPNRAFWSLTATCQNINEHFESLDSIGRLDCEPRKSTSADPNFQACLLVLWFLVPRSHPRFQPIDNLNEFHSRSLAFRFSPFQSSSVELGTPTEPSTQNQKRGRGKRKGQGTGEKKKRRRRSERRKEK